MTAAMVSHSLTSKALLVCLVFLFLGGLCVGRDIVYHTGVKFEGVAGDWDGLHLLLELDLDAGFVAFTLGAIMSELQVYRCQ